MIGGLDSPVPNGPRFPLQGSDPARGPIGRPLDRLPDTMLDFAYATGTHAGSDCETHGIDAVGQNAHAFMDPVLSEAIVGGWGRALTGCNRRWGARNLPGTTL
jgi:hypothetical protein